ncbi:hypothetical protein COCNU_12G000090 [Cocos nucifera]|uniref:Uncharacterized protein n=1 Tax=Cocos nucifera TaxID=13894 RepID=A0A8K0IQP0_COCNU|nr:hypothetical protein COCNU_12G000090 [Cocos nucifera]
MEVLKVREDLQAEINHLQAIVAEAESLMGEKVVENECLHGALQKKEFISIGLKMVLALEERRKEVEGRVAELEFHEAKSISEAVAQTVEEFKSSSKMRDLNIAFSQKTFIKDFELYEGKVARRFSELDLEFLEEDDDKEVGPSDAVIDPSSVEPTFDSSEPTVETPEPV